MTVTFAPASIAVMMPIADVRIGATAAIVITAIVAGLMMEPAPKTKVTAEHRDTTELARPRHRDGRAAPKARFGGICEIERRDRLQFQSS